MKKTIPALKSDEDVALFVETADLGAYDLSGQFVKFELRPKDKVISLRLPESLLTEVQACAKRIGIPYQRFVRLAIERALQGEPKP